jgi:ketosteroid isomerase-like protein
MGMSQENVEILKAGFVGFESGQFFELLDPEIEWEARPDLPDAGIYRGHDGVRQLIGRFSEVIDDIWFRPEEFIPIGEDRVAVPLRWGGKGKGSGVVVEETRETWLFTLSEGKVVRVQEFATREQALEGAGPRE